MLVKDIMTSCVSCVRPDSPLSQVAKQMKQENIGSIPVCSDSGKVMGIITDRDIVLRAVAQGQQDLKAQDIMTQSITCASPSMNTHDAAMLLSKHQIRRLPVVSSDRLVGIVSLGDIAQKTILVDEAGDALSAISKPNGLS
ncbi:CBS domain-containing protein [Aminipila butyrica]|uniref:CBS domain-containing protein n=1 Tax=Aminipila butyrica TaxID=433296 RepID=A0A858BXR8_9FIRM|nr:CBS domain-containing protein [Aminipila butyrica]QIB69979.1 CBS domain-containing protein [Aminipila butyrica]